MSDARTLESLLHDAEAAAEAGDYPSALPLLREAASRQTDSLGPAHPDLAKTLNNLALVCEMTGDEPDAERYYRQAVDIATSGLPSDHALVATSRANLRDFCEARGLPIEASLPEELVETPPRPVSTPAPTPVAGAAPAPIAAAPAAPAASPPPMKLAEPSRPKAEVHHRPPDDWAAAVPKPAANRGRHGWLWLGAALVLGLVAVAMIATREHPSAADLTPLPSDAATAPPEATTPAPAAVAPSTPPAASPDQPAPRAASEGAPVRPPATRAGTSRSAVTLTEARLCRSLSTTGAEWRCQAPRSPVTAGPLVFYSRVRSARGTTIEHRWYRDDVLTQAVELRIAANPGAGYRTYSRQTIDGAHTGAWRVEVRDAAGAVVGEERFVVR